MKKLQNYYSLKVGDYVKAISTQPFDDNECFVGRVTRFKSLEDCYVIYLYFTTTSINDKEIFILPSDDIYLLNEEEVMVYAL